MSKASQNRVLVVGVLALVVGLLALASSRSFGRADDDPKATGLPRYTVIETQGFNLLVTDNAANKLYYYATDKDAPVGAPLKLRASLNLTKVGEKEITITPHNLENMRKKKQQEENR
jgi:hypothetical protein